MPAQPLDQARDCGKDASDNYCSELGEHPHAHCFKGPGPVFQSSQAHAVDHADDTRNAGTMRHVSTRFCLGNGRTSHKPHIKYGKNDHLPL